MPSIPADTICAHRNVTRKMYVTWCNHCGETLEDYRQIRLTAKVPNVEYKDALAEPIQSKCRTCDHLWEAPESEEKLCPSCDGTDVMTYILMADDPRV